MAEAVVDGTPMSRFFCHKCSIEIERLLPDYTCPRCASGFIEELESGSNDSGSGMDISSEDLSDIDDPPLFSSGHNVEHDIVQMMQAFINQRQPSNISNRSNASASRRRSNWSRNTQDTHRSNSSRGRQEMVPAPLENIMQEVLLNLFGGDLSNSVTQDGQQPISRGRQEMVPTPVENIMQEVLLNLFGGDLSNSVTQDGQQPIVFLGNPGDYVWAQSGLDAIVTQMLDQVDGTGPPPLPRKQIAEIPTTAVTQSQVDSKLKCSVCWEDFKLFELVRQLPCQHLYHEPCIVPWLELHGTCPICRQSLGDQSTAEANQDTVGSSLAAFFRAANESNTRTSSSSAGNNSSSNSTSDI